MLGSSLRGLADAARLAGAHGHEVVLYDAEHPGVPDELDAPATVLDPTWAPSHLDGVDRVVTSPWFAEIQPPLADVLRAEVPVVTEAGFGLEHLDIPVVAVTGTNGKTTVTEVATEMLRTSGIDALAAGNIGRPVSSVRPGDADILVLELSSYQLRFMPRLVPVAATILNIAPDHLDWHGSYAAYAEAKARIVREATPSTVFAYDPVDPLVSRVAATTVASVVACSGTMVPAGGNGVDGDDIVIGQHRCTPVVADASFRFDLVVAGTLATAAGASPEAIGSVIRTFRPGPHRRELVAVIDGIEFVDDSKATNPHATVAAVGQYASVVLLAGGRNKGLDLTPIGHLEDVRHLVAFGESGSDIAAVAGGPVTLAPDLAGAFRVAVEIAEPGDTVLLSPGCASFDEFDSYAQRGEAFHRLVADWQGVAA